MPLAMSSANFTAWLWSTTRAEDEEEEEDKGQEKKEVRDKSNKSGGVKTGSRTEITLVCLLQIVHIFISYMFCAQITY